MKKMLTIVAIAALTATSCTKDRTCTCTDSSGGNPTVTTLVKVSNGQAKANCVTTKRVDSKGNTYTQSCTLK